ncbi:heme-dependent peroxidase [Blastopirellula sp. JC732]|uniref:Heme-dependent peroxidase n=1 Tax=Blastopirellula sediminis TaxID=2894196 RepID=A0A9X1MK94_9BACT|nr:hydrogen peroxide-dependent heme synthase [Blastopirellula sediminis]MCC9608203.1 heme-dependent peroxidase [Blastopirellula sediminis]MCC9627004.1 heme-dependent peroxidase [Blastopirellula sediminis]
MSHGRPGQTPPPPPSIIPTEGWHCAHFFYSFDRALLGAFDFDEMEAGRAELMQILNPEEGAVERLQTSIVSGHKADFGVMIMDPDPLKVDSIHQSILASTLGPAIQATYSFISLSEVSEYVPSVEQYGERLVRDGEVAGSEAYEAKVNAYRQREPMMRKQRLTPEFPQWPATCFYPMNKKRKVGENWFTLPFSERNALMAEHAQSGMQFAGRVSQLITVSVGLDDWEWGVTLWARNPEYLKEIVYKMRFDEASARYAEFGPFYTSYVCTAEEMLNHCRVR